MKQNRTDRVLLGISMGGFVLMSVSFLLMPMEIMGILPGMLFWGGFITGVVFQIVLEARRRAFFAAYNVNREKMQKPQNGLLTFGSNRFAIIFDHICVISVAATILAFIFTKGSGYLCYLCITIMLLSFCMHCIFNGRIYFHVHNQTKVRQVLEQKKANNIDKGEGENGKN